MRKMIQNLKNHLINLPGWRTNRKIVVFESDDWGSIRMTSKETFCRLSQKGYPIDSCPYNRNDALENNEDVAGLAEILHSVKDRQGRPARFTLNNIVANPDFDRIKGTDFQAYFYEPFPTTLLRYANSDRVMEIYRQGMAESVFQPQFHGREHVNVNRWLEGLQQNNSTLLSAFEERMFSLPQGLGSFGRRDYLDSFGLAYRHKYESESSIIHSGTELFKTIWGFRSESFIAPCYVWPSEIEPELLRSGIRYIQGTHVQLAPKPGLELKIKKKYHWQGQRNSFGQRFLVRNVHFEPVEQPNSDVVGLALKKIALAFTNQKPAIISSHRVNYIGRLRPENRDQNLKLLDLLLKAIVQLYPDVEFISSDQLGHLMDTE